MIKSFILASVLAPALALAAPKKSTKTEAQGTTSAQTVSFKQMELKGFSIYAGLNFNDTVTPSRGQDLSTDKDFLFGAQYQFAQFSPGLSIDVGGTYEMTRKLKQTGREIDLKMGMWTGYSDVVVAMTPRLNLFGGLNYSFPSVSGESAKDLSIKGQLGYQMGASFAINKNFAIDGRYRVVKAESTGKNEEGANVSVDNDMKGLMAAARYMF